MSRQTIRLTVDIDYEGDAMTPEQVHGLAIDALSTEVYVSNDHGLSDPCIRPGDGVPS